MMELKFKKGDKVRCIHPVPRRLNKVDIYEIQNINLFADCQGLSIIDPITRRFVGEWDSDRFVLHIPNELPEDLFII